MGGTAALCYATLAPPEITVNGIVSIVGACDLADLWARTSEPLVKAALQRALGGSPQELGDEYALRSPLCNVARLDTKTVVVLIAAEENSCMPAGQAVAMYEALIEHGNQALLVKRPGGHDDQEYRDAVLSILTVVGEETA